MTLVLSLRSSELQACACLLFLGAGISGPKTLIGIAIRDIVPADSAGVAGGVLGLCGQLGLTLAASGIALTLQTYRWSYFIYILLVSSILLSGVFLSIVLTRGLRYKFNTLPKVE